MSLDRDGRDQLACDGELGAEEILGVRLSRRYLDREGAHMGGVVVDERRAAREVLVLRPGPPVVVQRVEESLSAAERASGSAAPSRAGGHAADNSGRLWRRGSFLERQLRHGLLPESALSLFSWDRRDRGAPCLARDREPPRPHFNRSSRRFPMTAPACAP